MEASAWRNTKKDARGNTTFGIQVGEKNREQFFKREWKTIEVEMDGRFYQFKLTGGFWRQCPEFRESRREPVIREWLQRHRSLNWPFGKRPKVDLIPLGNGKFRLED